MGESKRKHDRVKAETKAVFSEDPYARVVWSDETGTFVIDQGDPERAKKLLEETVMKNLDELTSEGNAKELEGTARQVREMKTEPRHEQFYSDIMLSAMRNRLQDREIVALLGVMIGRAIGGVMLVGGTEEDRRTLVDTAVYNMKLGREAAPSLFGALGAGHPDTPKDTPKDLKS